MPSSRFSSPRPYRKNRSARQLLQELESRLLLTAPINDNFGSSILLTGNITSTTGTNVDATKQNGEPAHAGNDGGASVWWRWTATQNGLVRIDTNGSAIDTLLGIYTGTSVDQLTSIVTNDDDPDASDHTSSVLFFATTGTTYRIAVDGFDDVQGDLTLHVQSFPIPANDAFANRITIPSTGGTFTGTSVGATKEAGEPDHAQSTGGHSVWWTWTAPVTGVAVIDTSGSNFDTLLGVYGGSSVGSLIRIPGGGNDDENTAAGIDTSKVLIAASQGVQYQIAVDGFAGDWGSVTLHLHMTPPGDANGSGVVDATDFDTWFRNVGLTNAEGPLEGDLNGDGFVDASDFDVWFRHVGEGSITALQPAAEQLTVATLKSDQVLITPTTPAPVSSSPAKNEVTINLVEQREFITVAGSYGSLREQFTRTLRPSIAPFQRELISESRLLRSS